ncbi:MAG TPA: GerMN domain-containing protein [Clostridia bacterium]|nr:GerMN domain-containing protein [Clostridia bacterium]HHY05675.1 GerMN domain-containing protein [Clostridia bacterium]
MKRKSYFKKLLVYMVIMGCFFLMVVGCGQDKQKQGGENQPPVSPHPKTEVQLATLYFADEDVMYLVPEEREIKYAKDNLPQAIIEELVKGPQSEELRATLPETTRLLSLEVSEGTAYVNLSKEFERDYPGGSTGELMALGSIVRSLTELENIQRVQFLLEGKKVDVLAKGHMDLSEPLRRGVTLGNIEQLFDELQRDQEAANQGKLPWRLDPLEAAKKEGPRRGLYAQGEYKLVSQKEKGEYSGTGEAVVRHMYKNASYKIMLIQPVKVGSGGIWAINSIEEDFSGKDS